MKKVIMFIDVFEFNGNLRDFSSCRKDLFTLRLAGKAQDTIRGIVAPTLTKCMVTADG